MMKSGINDIDIIKKYNSYRVIKSYEDLKSITNEATDNDLISRVSNWFKKSYKIVEFNKG